jgi:hypothetical protein
MRSPSLPRRLDTAVSGKPKTSNIAPWNPKNFWEILLLIFSLQQLFHADSSVHMGPVSLRLRSPI